MAVNQLIENSFRKFHANDFSIICFAFRSDGNGIALGGDLPSIRCVQFPDVVFAMRIAAEESQQTVFVRCFAGDQCIRHECSTVVVNVRIAEQSERKTFTRDNRYRACDGSICMTVRLDDLLFFSQDDFSRKVGVADRNCILHDCGLIIRVPQFNQMWFCAEDISIRCGKLKQMVFAQRQVRECVLPICTCRK